MAGTRRQDSCKIQMVQFCSMFMRQSDGRRYSDIIAPFRNLTRQNARFKWIAECKQSFKELKLLLTESQIMVNFDVKPHTRLYVNYGPGGMASTIA